MKKYLLSCFVFVLFSSLAYGSRCDRNLEQLNKLRVKVMTQEKEQIELLYRVAGVTDAWYLVLSSIEEGKSAVPQGFSIPIFLSSKRTSARAAAMFAEGKKHNDAFKQAILELRNCINSL